MAARHAIRIGRYGLVGVVALSACARARIPAPTSAADAAPPACWLALPPSTPADSLVIVVDDRIGDGLSEKGLDFEALMASLTVDDTVLDECARERARRPDDAVVIRSASEVGEVRPSLDAQPSSGDPGGIGRGGSLPAPQSPVRVVRLGAGDPRDALDEGAGALVTADLRTLRYARARSDLIVIALAPRWSYGVSSIGSDSAAGPSPAALDDLRRSLARDVLPVDARATHGLVSESVVCARRQPTSAQSRSRVAPTIAYRTHDPVARAIAERLVSLSASGDETVRALLPARGLGHAALPRDAEDLARAVEAGDDAASVIVWRTQQTSVCDASGSHIVADPSAAVDGGTAIWPLVVVTEWLIVRRGAAGVVIDSAGALRLTFESAAERGAP